MSVCGNCGAPIDGAAFSCGYCGSELKKGENVTFSQFLADISSRLSVRPSAVKSAFGGDYVSQDQIIANIHIPDDKQNLTEFTLFVVNQMQSCATSRPYLLPAWKAKSEQIRNKIAFLDAKDENLKKILDLLYREEKRSQNKKTIYIVSMVSVFAVLFGVLGYAWSGVSNRERAAKEIDFQHQLELSRGKNQ